MPRLLLPAAAALFACTPSPKESAMPSSSRDSQTAAEAGGKASAGRADLAPADSARAAVAPMPEPISAAANPLPASPDSPAEGEGRRTLSTAFVRVGPDGQLTVELRDGRVLILRDVVMRPKDYCGVQAIGGAKGARYCGGYAEVAAARPGGVPSPGERDQVAPNPAKPAHD